MTRQLTTKSVSESDEPVSDQNPYPLISTTESAHNAQFVRDGDSSQRNQGNSSLPKEEKPRPQGSETGTDPQRSKITLAESPEMDRSRKPRIINSFHVCGTSFKRAPLEVRERVAVPPGQLGETVRQFIEKSGVREATIFSNCFRTEFYVYGAPRAPRSALEAFWTRTFKITPACFQQFVYLKSGAEGVCHFFRVVTGLDSLIVGESQVPQQIARALDASRSSGASGAIIERIFGASLLGVARVQTQSRFGRRVFSMDQTVIQLLKRVFGSVCNCTILVIGGGHPCGLAPGNLKRFHAGRVLGTSPNPQEALELAQDLGDDDSTIPWSNVLEAVMEADVIINASFSGQPLLSCEDYERIRPVRQRRALFLLDLTVPRGFDPTLSSYSEIFLHNVDDIIRMAGTYCQQYNAEIREVESLVQQEVEAFLRHL